MYEGKLADIVVVDTTYGKGLRWVFDVDVEGTLVSVSGVTSTKFSNRSKAFAWFTALGGEVKNRKINLRDVIGRKAMVEVRKRVGRDGKTEFANVVDVKPLPKMPKKKK